MKTGNVNWGPGEFDLAVALLKGDRNGPREDRQKQVTFGIYVGVEHWEEYVMVDSISRTEKDSCKTLIITGTNSNKCPVRIIYNTLNRAGVISIGN